MSAVYDMVAGTAPEIDQQACRERRIGVDRVWRVGVFMFSHLHKDAVYTRRSYIATSLGINERDVIKAVEVLEVSGIVKRDGRHVHPQGTTWPSVHWVPGWDVSPHTHKQLDVEVDVDACAREGIGVDRAWRIAVVAKHLSKTSAAVLASLTGIAERSVRKAARVLGLVLDKTVKERIWSNIMRPVRNAKRRGKRMPWAMFADDYQPDEDVTPTRQLSMSPKNKEKGLPRQARPVETWSPLDSAREFRERFLMSCPNIPGSTGDTTQIAKILGRMRKEYGHDARVEMFVLAKFLQESSYLYKNPHIAPWRKFLAAFYHHYNDAEKQVQAVDKTYRTAENKHHVRRRKTSEEVKAARKAEIQAQSAEREAELLEALGYKDGVFV